MKIGTRLLHSGVEVDPVTGAVSTPIYQVSTFRQESPECDGKYDYARSGSPTRDALEELAAGLESGSHGFAFSSGMAAISSVLLLLSTGDHVVACSDIYGGTYRVLTKLFNRLGINVTFTDTTDIENVRSAIRPSTRALLLETPSNPLLRITDLRKVVALAGEKELITIVDNTLMTPYWQRPLELGIDIVIHSATKYLGGHSDLIAGLAIVRDAGLAERLRFIQNSFGAILGPQDCWLLMRGIKTLKVRMEQHQAGAQTLARWLNECPKVKAVYYPGLPEHSGHRLHREQTDGYGGIISFRTMDGETARQMLQKLKLPVLAVSLGAVESIITRPCSMSHASIPAEQRQQRGITDDLIRYSVGLEEPSDIIADLEQALS